MSSQFPSLLVTLNFWFEFIRLLVVPFLVCIIAFLADRQFFNRNDDFCWIRPTSVVFAVVIPLTVLVVNCIICSIIMTSRLYPNLRITAPIRRLVRTNSTMLAKSTRQKSRDRFLAILSIQFVLGLPWVSLKLET